MKIPKSLFVLLVPAALCVPGTEGAKVPHLRLNDLARDSVENGQVSYQQIAEACYGDETGRIIESKRAWRAANSDAPWFSDYDLLSNVAVNIDLATERRPDDAGILARYEFESNTVTLPRDSAGALLAHEVAHGLTRRSVRSSDQKRHVDPRLDIGIEPPRGAFARESGFHLEWLSYVVTQCEFEVRLQALNRFFFEVEGRVIDSSSDALRAVVAIGAEVHPDEAVALLARRRVFVDAVQARAICGGTRYVWSAKPECFQNADDLRKALQMAAAWNPDIRMALLDKIVTEAPGHY